MLKKSITKILILSKHLIFKLVKSNINDGLIVKIYKNQSDKILPTKFSISDLVI